MQTTPGRAARRTALLLVGLAMVVATAAPASGAYDHTQVKGTGLWESGPAADDGYFAWVRNSRARPRHFDYFVQPTGESAYRVNERRTFGFGGGIDGTTLVYQQINRHRTDSDVKLWDLSSMTRSNPAGVNSSMWEWSPSISGDWILFGRNKFARPSSAWRVILFNTSTQTMRVLDSATYRCGCIWPGQVQGDYATWTKCAGGTCQVFLHTISTNTSQRIPNPYDRHQYFGSVAPDGTVYFARSGNACGAKVKIVSWVSGGPDAGAVVWSLPRGKDIWDRTYVHTDGSALDHVYYDRFSCRRGGSDIWVLDEQSVTRPVPRSRDAGARGSGPKVWPLEAAEP